MAPSEPLSCNFQDDKIERSTDDSVILPQTNRIKCRRRDWSKRRRSKRKNHPWPAMMLLLLLLVPLLQSSHRSAHAFVPYTTRIATRRRRWFFGSIDGPIPQPSHTASTTTPTPLASSAVDPTARFHSDLVRVLESRRRHANTTDAEYFSTCMERRKRPDILDNDIDGAERAYKMLQHMIELGVATEDSFQLVMRAFVKRGRLRWSVENTGVVCAADQVEQLLQQLECQDASTIRTETYNLVLEAFANCATPRGERNYAKRADTLLDRMEEQNDVQSVVHVLHAWSWQQANMNAGDCAQRANDLLENLEDMVNGHDNREEALQLMQSYDWILEAWSKSNSEGSPQKADVIFQRMKELKADLARPSSSSTQDNVPMECTLPNSESYSNCILAWSKCPGETAVRRAHEVLLEMVHEFRAGGLFDSEPELIAFNAVITAWARLGRPDKAESILWLMDDLQQECRNLVPDVLTYNAVLHAHVKSSNKDKALDRIIDIVGHMEENWKDQPAIRPESFTYNTLMKAWVQSGYDDAAEQVEAILTKMERLAERSNDQFELSNRHFNILINAYAKSNDRSGTRKAHGLLKRMQGSNHVQPDIISFTSVIECYSKSKDPEASVIAEQLLKEAFDHYNSNGRDPALMPNLRTFTMVILSLARSPRRGNTAKARGLLDQLVKLYEETEDDRLKPNEYPYNYVLNCAANTLGSMEDKIKAFQLATKTYQDMRKSSLVAPDSFTYAFWIKACNNLLPKTELYGKCVSLAFEQCKQDGLVSAEVLSRLQQGVSLELCRKLLGGAASTEYRTLKAYDLPAAWTRKTKIPRRRRF